MSGNFPLTIETPSAIAEQVLGRLFYGQDLKELETYRDRVERVTVGDITRVSRDSSSSPISSRSCSSATRRRLSTDSRRWASRDFERIPLAAARPELADAQAHLAGRPRTTAASSGAAPRVIATSEAGHRVMISCGEASGDLYAGALVRALTRDRAGRRGVRVRRRPAARGRRRSHRRLRRLLGHRTGRSARACCRDRGRCCSRSREAARERRPDVFVAIDFPDFNFRLLPSMKALGVPIVYYVSPQLWAWRPRRLETIRRYGRSHARDLSVRGRDLRAGRRARRVRRASAGRPGARDAAARGCSCARWDSIPAGPVLALLPGSRPNELRLVLPVLAAAAPLIGARVPACSSWSRARRRSTTRCSSRSGRMRAAGLSVGVASRGDRRCAGRGGRRRHGVGHGDRAGGAARHADGDRLPAVGG